MKYYCSLIVLIFTLLISGCYTLVEHPDVSVTEDGETYLAAIMFYDNCTDCHSTDEVSEYYFLANDQILSPHKLNEEKFYQISEHGNFDFFYNSVWWYDEDYIYKFSDEEDYSQIEQQDSNTISICSRSKMQKLYKELTSE